MDALLEAGEEEGILEESDRELVRSAVEFGDKVVLEVMTPRPEIFAVPGTLTLRKFTAEINEHAFSRVPVYSGSLDNVTGIAFAHDLLNILDAEASTRTVAQIQRPAAFVPETKKVAELLREMQREKQHMRIVIDEYGSVAGLVTIEDLLEAIVGNIADEHDEPEADDAPIREPNGAYVVSGSFELSRLRDLFADQFEPANRRAVADSADSEAAEPTQPTPPTPRRPTTSATRATTPPPSASPSTTNPPPSAASSPRSPATSPCPAKSSKKTASASKSSPAPTAASTASASASSRPRIHEGGRSAPEIRIIAAVPAKAARSSIQGTIDSKVRRFAKALEATRSSTRQILSLAAVCSLSSSAQPPLQRFHQTHPAMGTIFTIDLNVTDQATAEQDMDLAFDEIDRLEALLSNYRPSSELSRISREAGSAPVVTDPETFRFLDRSIYWSRVSNGAFDITVGPLLRAWGFFFHHGRIPSQTRTQRPPQQSRLEKCRSRPRNPHRLLHQSSADGTRPRQHRQRLRRRQRRQPPSPTRASPRPSSPPAEAPSTQSEPFPEPQAGP